MIIEPCDKNAIPEVRELLEFLASIEGKRILTGQHTQTMGMEEIEYIYSLTGKKPVICGFELLAYSPNINWEKCDEACLKEIMDAMGTVEKAYEWAESGGIVTFTWHWFSPIGGFSKAFYSANTEFDVEKAVIEGTIENIAMCHDMDVMAEILRGFEAKKIPVLWRPFHESEGNWFWWGAKGAKTAADAYRYMFRYFTEKKKLHNLVWVWNCPLKEGYVGDDFCDIVSRDLYPPKHANDDYAGKYFELIENTSSKKGIALAETGVVPDIEKALKNEVNWLWYMTWSHDFALSDEYNSKEFMQKLYRSDKVVTLDDYVKL
ncbi:MAG: glycoside hydrolase family 26 protein [Lachnospiraceae bacterium]|nr:glycoside hydrolase family 26 protein [Lachnospiraceae bacterium]